jgi:hypothetical protein
VYSLKLSCFGESNVVVSSFKIAWAGSVFFLSRVGVEPLDFEEPSIRSFRIPAKALLQFGEDAMGAMGSNFSIAKSFTNKTLVR